MENKKIVMLAGKGKSTNILYNALKEAFSISTVILEEPVNKAEFLKKRLKKLGVAKVIGQVLFQLMVVKWLDLTSSKRKKEILQQYQLDDSAIAEENIIHVNSVNDESCLQHLQQAAPDIVIVNGTRILSKKILNSVTATFINTHVGITPKYRGVHGGYWALANNDRENVGVTIHLVDNGIDTGGILYQKTIAPGKNDNFVTYPLLQLAEGIPYMKKALKDISNGAIIPTPERMKESKLWHHPTIGQYLYNRLKKGVK